MKHHSMRLLSLVLCFLLLISIVPTTVFAAVAYNHDSSPNADGYYNVVSKKDWSIAPGIEESEIVLNNDLGTRRQVAHVMVADTTNEYVKVTTSYANMDTSVYATANMMLQATAAKEKLGWNVVGAMNTCLSWYTGYPSEHYHEPLGFMMIDGETVWDLTKKYGGLGFPTCVVIYSDERPEGMPKVEMKSITGTQDLNGYEEQVIPCSSGFIVNNGVNTSPTPNHDPQNTASAPRSVVGITADGKVIMMENDGRQSISAGMTLNELAELMIDLGCTYACNCDGGGSSTFLSKRPGAELECVNSPSDGSLRETTSGIMFTSTAPSDGQFAIAHISSEDKYYTPNSSVQFSVIGTDLAGNEVEIPAEAQWALADNSFGTIDQNGLFTSTGKTGTATAQITMPDTLVNDRTVVFSNNKGLKDINIYYWSDDNDNMVAWPGKPMISFGKNEYNEPRYRYDLPEGATKFIINGKWNDDQAFQTGNLDFNGKSTGGVYLNNSNGAERFDISDIRKVTGEASIEIVIPEISFTTATFSVKYGTTAELTVVATTNNGVNEVVTKPGDYVITCNNSDIGTISGTTFTAVDADHVPDNQTGTLTASLSFAPNVTATGRVVICREITETIFSFDGQSDKWMAMEIGGEGTYASLGKNYIISDATDEDGQVRYGDGSMKLYTNQLNAKILTNGGSKDYYQLVLMPKESVVLNDVQSYGVWVYLDDEMYAHEFNMRYMVDANNDGVFDTIKSYSPIDSRGIYQDQEESGWYYLKVDVGGKNILIPGADINSRSDIAASLKTKALPMNCRTIHIMGYPHTAHEILRSGVTVNGKYNIYFDNFTVDYAVDVADRTAPEFGNITLLSSDGSDDKNLAYGRTKTDLEFKPLAVTDTADNTLDITANVSDAGDGLNGTTAKAYIDGKQVASNYANGKISISGIAVSQGIHRVKFEIADRAGNKQVAVRLVNVTSAVDASTIVVEPKDATLDKIPCGSVYWMDLKATDIETIQSVSATIDLNSSNHWELDHAEVADGFSYVYSVNSDNNTADITITRTGENTQTGEAVLASLPIRVISFDDDIQYPGKTAATYWTDTTINFWSHNVSVDVDCGEIEYVADYTPTTIGTFSNESFSVETEMYLPQNYMIADDNDFFTNHASLHVHNAAAAPDLAPTCTKPGYTGRTFCEDCNSVVDWGTEVPATNHNLTTQPDGLYICPDCGDAFYLKDGELQSGSYFVDGKMYTFDDDGNYLPDYKYDGFYEINDTVMFFNNGVYYTGYKSLNNNFYWFDENGFGLDGVVEVCGENCTFDDGLFVADSNILLAGSCGEDAEFVIYANGDMVVDGSGAVTEYTNVGQVPWRANFATTIKTLWIGKDITSIGNLSFRNLSKLHTVTFEAGSKLENISHTGFAYDYALTEIYLPEGIKTVRSAAFYNCSNLEFVYLPSSLTLVDRDAFNGCSKLTASVVLNTAAYRMVKDAGIDYILRVEAIASGTSGDTEWWINSDGTLYIDGDGAMADYSSAEAPFKNYANQITSVVIGSDVTAIGQFALYGLKKVTYVGFEPDSKLETIGWGAFGQMSALTEITIPASVTEIKAYAFYYDTALATVNFEEDSALTTIGKQAFWKDAALEYVFIPDNVSSIGNDAFLEADNGVFSVARNSYAHKYFAGKNLDIRDVPTVNLYEGTIGDVNWAVTNDGKLIISGEGDMPDYAVQEAPWFQYSKLIDTIEIGNEITSIGQFCFYGLKNVTSVVFEADSSIETIGWGAFGQESKLTEITIPASVVEIKAYAFYYDTALTAVYFEEDSELTTIGKLAFWHDANLEFVYIPDFVSSIGSEAFLDADYGTFSVVRNSYAAKYFAGKNLDLRNAPAYNIYEGAVNDTVDWAITSEGKLVISGEGAMEDYAVQQAPWFQYSKLIDTVVIGNEITYTGQFAFYGLKNVTAVEFEADSKLETIGWGSFGQESKLAEITLPASVVEIKAYAFYYDTALEWVDFEDDSALTTIGKLAFWKDAALEYVFIPDGVTSIGKEAFLEADNGTFDVLGGSYAETYFAGKDVAIR